MTLLALIFLLSKFLALLGSLIKVAKVFYWAVKIAYCAVKAIQFLLDWFG
jgi:hypothetical protein